MRSFHDEPIITSLLDVDFYKFTMGAFIRHYYPDLQVVFGLKNRTTKVRLAELIDVSALRAELDHVRTLRIDSSESYFLRGMDLYQEHMFADEYIRFLRNLRLPDYELCVVDGQFDLRFAGPWSEVTYWETLALSIINELFYRGWLKRASRFDRQAVYASGIRRLHDKIGSLRNHPRISVVEFGTRRRFGRVWQSDVVRALVEEIPGQCRGTSNTKLAMDFGLTPMGTNAHELQMATAAAVGVDDDALVASHNRILRQWWEMYGFGLSIALTDTFGSDFFFRDFTADQARAWKGLRHDSGNPLAFATKALEFYQRLGIDPHEKMIIFSDGLELKTILQIDNAFGDLVTCAYGWGTNLSCDVGLPTLSLVAKVIEANGRPAVKLSDNLAKAIGPAEEVERYKRVFGQTSQEYTECKV